MTYKSFDKFFYRIPLLPYNRLHFVLENRDSLLECIRRIEVQEAIFLASPVLFMEIEKYIKMLDGNEESTNKVVLSCVRYISRMSTRCTPFGLFAGCGVGRVGDREEATNIIINSSIDKITRLDMYYLLSLYNVLILKMDFRYRVKYYPNTTLYKIGKRFRYIEILYTNVKRKYQITEVSNFYYVNKLLQIAQKGANIKTLTSILISDGISEESADKFVNDLIDSQVLVPELNQSVTGEDFFMRFISLLNSISDSDDSVLIELRKVKLLLDQLNSTIDSYSFKLYDEIIEKLKKLGGSYEKQFVFQVDMKRKSSYSVLNSDIINEIKLAMNFLSKITMFQKNEMLSRFKQDFYNRYEDREVALLEVLDPEIGIGYPSKVGGQISSSLINDLMLPRDDQRGDSLYNRIQSTLFQKIISSSNKFRELEVELTDADVEGLETNIDALPPTICAMVDIVCADPKNICIKLRSCGGSSAANLLSRFAHMDKEIEQLIIDITGKEQELMSDVILAEVVYSPEARICNILSRPHLREYEIPINSYSDLPQDKQILLSDLFLSMKQGKLIIRSKKLNKIVVPRLTTAHNYYNDLMPAYRFLCDMQVQSGKNGLQFNWEKSLEDRLSFLPRIKYRNTILSSAIWNVKVSELRCFFEKYNGNQLLDVVSVWRKEYFIPRYVLMPDGDNEFFVDWENTLSIHALYSIIKSRKYVRFVEFLFDHKDSVAKNTTDFYTNQCLVFFINNAMKLTKRVFIPGSKWVYFKLYTGYKTSDDLLIKDISIILDRLWKFDLIEKWFYIRYSDPDFHLRIRFLLKNDSCFGDVVNIIYKRLSVLINNKLIWKVQIDTYSQELERYECNLMNESEYLFYIDSECILSIIKCIRKCNNENYRWMIALKIIDCFLSDFKLQLEEKYEIVEYLSFLFKREFGFNQYNSKQFNSKYRFNKNIVESVLDNTIADQYFFSMCNLITVKSQKVEQLMSNFMRKLEKDKKAENRMTNFIYSHIHMSLNRLFISQSRMYELVLYDFLKRYYASQIARNK